MSNQKKGREHQIIDKQIMEHVRLMLSERMGSQSYLCPLSSSHFNLFKTQLFLLVKKRGHNILVRGCLEYVIHYKIQCIYIYIGIVSVQFSCSVMSDSLQPSESQHTRPPCPSPSPGVHSDSRPI